MPKRYEETRDSLMSQGKPAKEAKSMAAAIENKRRKAEGKPPMRPHTKGTRGGLKGNH